VNVGFAKYAAVLVIFAFAAIPQAAIGQQKKGKSDMVGKGKAEEKMAGDSEKAADSGKDAPAPKIYRFKGEKKGAAAGTPMMILLVEDVFTGKAETFYVPNNDATSKEYDPLSEVVSLVKELQPGAPIEVETEKQKGRTMVKSVAKADAKPGEELPNGFVFVEQREDTSKSGATNVIVTLSKFGREVKAAVAMHKSTKKDSEGEWEPDSKVDYQLRRLKGGMVVEATIKPGRTPMLTEIYEYLAPERGKYIGLKEVEFGKGKAAGFEIASDDGTPVTFTIDSTEQTKNGQTIYIPSPQQLASVRKLKKDTPVEVRYRLDGRAWVLRGIRLLGPNESLATAPKENAEDTEKMKPEKDSGRPADKPEMADDAGDDSMDKDKDKDKKKDKATNKSEKPNP
jgi:hypothetical protein